MELFVPVGEILHTLFYRHAGFIAKLFDQIFHVRIGIGDISRLQGQHLFIGRYTERLFQCFDVVHQLHWVVVADIIDSPWGFAGGRIGVVSTPLWVGWRGPIEDTNHALYNIVNIGEVSTVLAVVEDLNLLSCEHCTGEFL